MNKRVVIAGGLALVGLVGIYFSSIHEGAVETTTKVSSDGQVDQAEDQIVTSTLGLQVDINEQIATEKVILSTEEISALKARSKQVRSELDSLTKELDSHLENPEKRKSIQAQYQLLADEQNMLAIQLVKVNQSQMAAAE